VPLIPRNKGFRERPAPGSLSPEIYGNSRMAFDQLSSVIYFAGFNEEKSSIRMKRLGMLFY
jgi:hypothetical protein